MSPGLVGGLDAGAIDLGEGLLGDVAGLDGEGLVALVPALEEEGPALGDGERGERPDRPSSPSKAGFQADGEDPWVKLIARPIPDLAGAREQLGLDPGVADSISERHHRLVGAGDDIPIGVKRPIGGPPKEPFWLFVESGRRQRSAKWTVPSGLNWALKRR